MLPGFTYLAGVVQDGFTGGDGRPLTANKPDVHPLGAGWVLQGGAPPPTLQGGLAGVPGSGPGHLQLTVDTGAMDAAVAVDYVVGSGPGLGGLVARGRGTADHFRPLTITNTR